MDLRYTPEQDAFRAEARAWLEANVPAQPLRSFDTLLGSQDHRAWEKKLNAGGWAMVPSGMIISTPLNRPSFLTIDGSIEAATWVMM